MELVDAGKEIPNDPEDNPCFCCGPRNPVGLKMRFYDDGTTVRSTLTLDERYGGTHAHVLSGLVFAAMDETLYWAAWARFGEHARAATDGPSELRFPRAVRVDQPFAIEASVAQDHGDLKDLRAVVHQGGETCATLAWSYRRHTRDEIEKVLERPNLERSNRDDFTQMLARR